MAAVKVAPKPAEADQDLKLVLAQKVRYRVQTHRRTVPQAAPAIHIRLVL